MTKYLHRFSTNEDFEEVYNGSGYFEPWVSSTDIQPMARVDYNKEEEPVVHTFYWGDAGSNVETSVTITSAASAINITYRTDYNLSDLTTAGTGGFVATSAVLNNGVCTITFPTNPLTDAYRVAQVLIKYRDNVIATAHMTQARKGFFLWSNGQTAMTETINSTATTASVGYTTNMTGLTLTTDTTYDWITQKGITNTSGNGNLTANTQVNDRRQERTAALLIKANGVTVGILTLKQEATQATFNVGGKVSTATGSICQVTCPASAEGITILSAQTVFYTTNLTDSEVAGSITLSGDSDTIGMFSVASNVVNTNQSSTKQDGDGVTSYKYISLFCNTNVDYERAGNIYIIYNGNVLATITVNQSGEPLPRKRQRLDTAIGLYSWYVGEERDAIGYWLFEESTDGGRTWHQDPDADEPVIDVSDDVEWRGMTESGIFQEVSFHRFKAVATGRAGNVVADYDGEYGSATRYHSYIVE